MSQLMALALSIGILGGIATWLFLAVGGVLIWAAFIAAACYFQAGADNNALKNTIVSNVFGSFSGWLTAMIILSVSVDLTKGLWEGIVVLVTVFGTIYASKVPALGLIPGNVYGYAATFAFLLQTPDALTTANLTSFSWSNAFLAVSVSMVLGAVYGMVSGKVAGMLTAKAA